MAFSIFTKSLAEKSMWKVGDGEKNKEKTVVYLLSLDIGRSMV